MKAAIIVFNGANCDVDVFRACEKIGWEPTYVKFDETSLEDYDVVILPGGFFKWSG